MGDRVGLRTASRPRGRLVPRPGFPVGCADLAVLEAEARYLRE
ncbi:hypothetical protein [Rubrivirga sp.]